MIMPENLIFRAAKAGAGRLPWTTPQPAGCAPGSGGFHKTAGRDRRLDGAVALTPAEAQRLQEDAQVSGRWLMWFVSYKRTGRVTARAVIADQHGGKPLPGELLA